jgi:hypothetical protein
VIAFGHISTPTKKFKTPYVKATYVINELKLILDKYEISRVNIEENLKSFAQGKTRADIIVLLAKFNGIISFYLNQIMELPIYFINASSARKEVLGRAFDRVRFPKDTKGFVLHLLTKMLGEEFVAELPRMKKKDAVAKEAGDICDAIVMCLY